MVDRGINKKMSVIKHINKHITYECIEVRYNPQRKLRIESFETKTEALIRNYLRRTEKIYLTKTQKNSKIFKYKNYNFKFSSGIPDYFYKENKSNHTFIEMKNIKTDGISFNQFEWIRNNPYVKVRIIFADIIKDLRI